MTKHEISGSESSCDSDSSLDDPPVKLPPPPPPVVNSSRRKAPLFTVVPNYVPKIPEALSADVELTPLGTISNMVDGCVIIQALPTAIPIDAGSALFLTGGKPLGEIYETFGPVASPFYVVVLPNSVCLHQQDKKYDARRKPKQTEEASLPVQETLDTGPSKEADAELPPSTDSAPSLECPSQIKPVEAQPVLQVECHTGDTVYYVKDNPDLTIPVFYAQLIQMKGSDASWVGDMEPPPNELEFSDDEQERLYKRNLKAKRRLPSPTPNSSSSSPQVKPKPMPKKQQSRPRPIRSPAYRPTPTPRVSAPNFLTSMTPPRPSPMFASPPPTMPFQSTYNQSPINVAVDMIRTLLSCPPPGVVGYPRVPPGPSPGAFPSSAWQQPSAPPPQQPPTSWSPFTPPPFSHPMPTPGPPNTPSQWPPAFGNLSTQPSLVTCPKPFPPAWMNEGLWTAFHTAQAPSMPMNAGPPTNFYPPSNSPWSPVARR